MQNAMKAFASYMREWVASEQINIFTRIDSVKCSFSCINKSNISHIIENSK